MSLYTDKFKLELLSADPIKTAYELDLVWQDSYSAIDRTIIVRQCSD